MHNSMSCLQSLGEIQTQGEIRIMYSVYNGHLKVGLQEKNWNIGLTDGT